MACTAMKSLVCWEKPVTSVAVFLPVAVVLLALSYWSLIYVMAWSALLLLLAVPSLKVFGIVMEKLGKPNPLGNPVEEISKVDLSVDKAKVQSALSTGIEHINAATAALKKIFLFEDVLETVKFGTLCYTLTYIGSWFNLMTLVLVSWVLLFSLPKVYTTHQEAVDGVLAKAKEQLDSLKAKVYPQVEAKKDE